MLRAEFRVAHALGILLKIISLNADLFEQLRIRGNDGTKRGHKIFNLTLIEQLVFMNRQPALLFNLLVGKQFASQIPKVLSSVKEIDDLNGAGEVLIGNIPDQFRSIADDDLLFGVLQPRLQPSR